MSGPTPVSVAVIEDSSYEASSSRRGFMSTTDKVAHDALAAGVNAGVIPSGRLKMATNPTNNDTVTIGGHVFKFLSSLVAANTYTQVKIGADAATTRASFVKAINGTADATVVEATSPFAGHVLAVASDTDKVLVQQASARGGTLTPGTTSVAVSEGLTAAADVWDVANLDETGKAAGTFNVSVGHIAITAAMLTRGKCFIDLPFTPTEFMVQYRNSSGLVLDGVCTDDAVISGNAIEITLGGGGAPALIATNTVTVIAWG